MTVLSIFTTYFSLVFSLNMHHILVLTALLSWLALSLANPDLSQETCDRVERPLLTEPTAQALIGSLFALSDPGSGGYGCGLTAKGEHINVTRNTYIEWKNLQSDPIMRK